MILFNAVYNCLLQAHIVAEHTKKILFLNQDVKDFCEESRAFAMIPTDKGYIYLHYDVSTWINQESFKIKIESICIYDDMIEYEKCRMSQLNTATNKDQYGSN